MTRNNYTGGGRVEAVHRALVLLKLMTEEGSLSVTEAAKALDIHPATAQRLLMTLVGDGFAQQGERRRYFLGPALLRTPPQVISLRERLRPHLERLFERTGETVHVGNLIGTEVHHPDGIESSQPLRFGLRIGVRLPAHITSEGKSMLAGLPWDEVQARYSVARLGRRGDDFNVDIEGLKSELYRVREQGFATNFEESEPGIAAFSISVGPIDGEHCALSIAVPIARYSDDLGDSYVRNLQQAAAEIREELAS